MQYLTREQWLELKPLLWHEPWVEHKLFMTMYVHTFCYCCHYITTGDNNAAHCRMAK